MTKILLIKLKLKKKKLKKYLKKGLEILLKKKTFFFEEKIIIIFEFIWIFVFLTKIWGHFCFNPDLGRTLTIKW
jgi:hypothetical protein